MLNIVIFVDAMFVTDSPMPKSITLNGSQKTIGKSNMVHNFEICENILGKFLSYKMVTL